MCLQEALGLLYGNFLYYVIYKWLMLIKSYFLFGQRISGGPFQQVWRRHNVCPCPAAVREPPAPAAWTSPAETSLPSALICSLRGKRSAFPSRMWQLTGHARAQLVRTADDNNRVSERSWSAFVALARGALASLDTLRSFLDLREVNVRK